MPEKYFQCCYTNAETTVGGTVSSGWQPVAVSPGIPSDVLSTCTSMQAVNSTIQGPMVDEAGKVLDLYEVFADGTYVYTMRSKYGMLDRLGRPNMFSHALVFNLKDSGALLDPNVFLGLDNANYKETTEEALSLESPLARMAPLTIDDALAEAKISREAYLSLVRCVYAKLTERSLNQPLYVQYDGTDRQLRLILFCVYWGLPYFLRKQLSAASVESNNAANRDLVFSMKAREKRTYVDPQTGENNILTKRLERKIGRYAFVDYAIMHLDDLDEETYYKELESVAVELGDPSASNPLVLKIAHLQIMGAPLDSLKDAEIEERISDALRSRPLGSDRMDAYIAGLMAEVVRRNLALTEESEADLASKVAATNLSQLAKVDEEYTIHRLAALPTDNAARRLTHLDEATLRRYTARLLETEQGKQILDSYYADYVLGGAAPTWEGLNKVLDATEAFKDARQKTVQRVYDQANDLYREALRDLSGIVENFQAYTALVGRLFPQSDAINMRNKARDAYWKRVSFADYDFSNDADLEAMQDGSARAEMFLSFARLRAHLPQAASDTELLTDVQRFFDTYDSQFADDQEFNDAADSVLSLLKDTYQGDDPLIESWANIMVEVRSAEMVDLVLGIRRSLYEGDYDTYMQLYRDLRKLSFGRGNETTKYVLSQVARIACDFSFEQEERFPDFAAPLDLWLLAGDNLCQNPFEVFDEYDAGILYVQDLAELLASSELMANSEYRVLAEQYVKSGGRARGTVKAWLRAAKKQGGRKLGGFPGFGGKAPAPQEEEPAEPFDDAAPFGGDQPKEEPKKGFFGGLFGGRK